MNGPNSWMQFLQGVAQDSSAQESLKNANNRQSFVEAAVTLGEKKGFSFTINEIEAQIAKTLSPLFYAVGENQLELVSGGKKDDDDDVAMCKKHTKMSFTLNPKDPRCND